MPKLPATQSYKGVFPVVPTVFDAQGRLDLEGQKRAVDFMIDAGSHGLCILANFSEQFVLTDEERERVMVAVLVHVAGRVPVIVTTTHFSSFVCAERSRRAQDLGAAMVMVMPPYHGATFRVPEASIYDFYRHVSDAISIPIMVQDAPVAGTPLSVPFLARMAREIENLAYFKIEVPQAAAKLRALIEAGGATIEGPWDGEEAITLMADLDAGATGAMTGGAYPDGIRQITDPYFAGRRDEAIDAYQRWLPLINYENRQCGLAACKALMREGGVIAHETLRAPLPAMHPATRAGLIEIARRLDPIVLRWGR
ncbi:MAG: dihydrodipicolinate synthase family protein [Bosea sp.]|uniref:dihydrodipicolinate synthase family protein n=1 Tax=unclassified Bosea (in: a-proteobacteria) TaxID=2653178 RepID=UPI00095AA385|nr:MULTISPECIES: dihydrodipicolinate synthase family protein [unclassified Bosea (in: a-proteobacteria)]MBN9458190.1 dihydrodipicolinate synthase family protein [Bosea sp. (in: a-proteobacteria)]OJV07065.1 MAG: dihydrodipicolinate synthase family protein [Bosea sp. 67-29]